MSTNPSKQLCNGLVLTLIAASPVMAQDALWVGRIGVDTAVVEATRQSGARISGTIVNIAAGLLVQRYEVELDARGRVLSLRSWGVADVDHPDAGAGAPTTIVAIGDDSIRVSRNGPGGTETFALPAVAGAVPVFDAFFNNPISLIDIALRQAAERGDEEVRLYYVGTRTVERLPLSRVEPMTTTTGDRAVGNRETRFAYPYVMARQYPMLEGARLLATMDGDQLVRFDATETTFKIVTDRDEWTDPLDMARDFQARGLGAGGFSTLSPPRRATGRVGSVEIEISYGSPSRRGRRIFPDVVPFGSVWRAGANAATQISFSGDVRLAGARVPAGSYSLWVLPGESADTLIINRAAQIWGVMYDQAQDLVRVPLRRTAPGERVEALTYNIVDEGGAGRLELVWDDRRFSVSIEPGG